MVGLVVVRLHETGTWVTGPTWLHICDGLLGGIGLVVYLPMMFGVKLGLTRDNQWTVGMRRQSPATGNRSSNRLGLSDDWRKSIGRLV